MKPPQDPPLNKQAQASQTAVQSSPKSLPTSQSQRNPSVIALRRCLKDWLLQGSPACEIVCSQNLPVLTL